MTRHIQSGRLAAPEEMRSCRRYVFVYDKTEGQEHCLLKKYGDNKFPDNWDDFCRVISRMSGQVFR